MLRLYGRVICSKIDYGSSHVYGSASRTKLSIHKACIRLPPVLLAQVTQKSLCGSRTITQTPLSLRRNLICATTQPSWAHNQVTHPISRCSNSAFATDMRLTEEFLDRQVCAVSNSWCHFMWTCHMYTPTLPWRLTLPRCPSPCQIWKGLDIGCTVSPLLLGDAVRLPWLHSNRSRSAWA